MRVLFVITHFSFWAPLDPIAQRFAGDGHHVRVLIDRSRNAKFEGRYSFGPGKQRYELAWTSSRGDGLQFLLNPLRELISYDAYLVVRKPTSLLLADRWASFLPRPMRPLIRLERFRTWLSRPALWASLRRLEDRAPISSRIARQLRRYAPDVVVAASAIMPYSKETDYIKAAKTLGIPTALIIPSWDNLTTKGTLHACPDWLLVWNVAQVREAQDLHFVPANRIYCTGAPKFDPWFEMTPTLDRAAFCKQIGIDPAKPFLLYLCSSEFIAGDETALVEQLARRLIEHPPTKDVTLVVRPHPQNLGPWAAFRTRVPNLVVWPKRQDSLETSATITDFHHSIVFSIGVIGVNTSAFIEASIVDRPCLAIASDRHTPTQMGIPHFRHLLDAGFLEISSNLDETLRDVAALLAGEDRYREQRRRFVREFVRPNGLEISAATVLSRAIENIALRRPPEAASEGRRATMPEIPPATRAAAG